MARQQRYPLNDPDSSLPVQSLIYLLQKGEVFHVLGCLNCDGHGYPAGRCLA